MIKVLDGKRYNTETAEMVFGWSNGHHSGDFRRRDKDLYRTKKGAWFIHHEGGALTDMAVSCGSGTTGSSRIEPVCGRDAMRFLEAHSDESDAMAAIESYFSDQVDDA